MHIGIIYWKSTGYAMYVKVLPIDDRDQTVVTYMEMRFFLPPTAVTRPLGCPPV